MECVINEVDLLKEWGGGGGGWGVGMGIKNVDRLNFLSEVLKEGCKLGRGLMCTDSV